MLARIVLPEDKQTVTQPKVHVKRVSYKNRILMHRVAPICYRAIKHYLLLCDFRVAKLRSLANNGRVVLLCNLLNLLKSGLLILCFAVVHDWIQAKKLWRILPLDVLVDVTLLWIVANHWGGDLVLRPVILGNAFFLSLFADAVHRIKQGKVIWRILILSNLNLVAAIWTW